MGTQTRGLITSPIKRTYLITIFAGFVVGFIAAYVYQEHNQYYHYEPDVDSPPEVDRLNDEEYKRLNGEEYKHLNDEEYKHLNDEEQKRWRDPHSHQDMADLPKLKAKVEQHNQEFQTEDDAVARQLEGRVRVLCWVMTAPQNHESKAQHVQATWGKRCNTLLFMSSASDALLPVVVLDVKEGHDLLWAKTKAAFTYVYQHHSEDYDWVLKADDDTYVIVENLRYLLSQHNTSDPVYFGCRFKPFARQGYMSGGAGYVLSKEAVKRFVTEAIPDENKCKPGASGAEDAEIGKCLENVGVIAMDSRDQYQRGRFFPFVPEHHLMPSHDPTFWYWNYVYYNTTDGLDCCSDTAVTFHYISPQEMYYMEYLIYHLRPFGILHGESTTTDTGVSDSSTTTEVAVVNATEHGVLFDATESQVDFNTTTATILFEESVSSVSAD